ncbi:hypothetical protein [Rhodococcus qingshengii]
MTESPPHDSGHVTDAQINAARTKLIIDEKLKRTSDPRITKLAQLKTASEQRFIHD